MMAQASSFTDAADGTDVMGLWAVTAVVIFAAIANGAQVLINSRVGTDHAVHAFLIRALRRNGHRLFTRIPDLLNRPACGALPLYLHWFLSFLPPRALIGASWLINPIANVLHVILVIALAGLMADAAALPREYVVLASALFAFTPQAFHALSARNFGISSRSIGLLLLTAFYASLITSELSGLIWQGYTAMIIFAYLVAAFNTFGLQALVLTALLMAIVGARLEPLGLTLAGVSLFVVIHPRYGWSYLAATVRFIRAYARELAPVYILARRPGVWRDLIYDIWVRMARSPIGGLRYAYENSVLVVVLLNPLLVIACSRWFGDTYGGEPMLDLATQIAICGALATVLTSFRATRFLGEPERYAEAVAPWAALAGTAHLMDTFGLTAGWYLLASFIALVLAQLYASRWLVRYLQSKPVNFEEASLAIRSRFGDEVRLVSNNEQYTKLLLENEWRFSYCIAVGEPYCGMSMNEAFSEFPFLTQQAVKRIVSDYRINIIVLDKERYDSIDLSDVDGLAGVEKIYQSQGLIIMAVKWAPV